MASRSVVSDDVPERPGTFSWRWLALTAIVVGVAVRTEQYAANPSLWVDEAAIALNVLNRQPSQLFGPLDYGQVAPPGFLLAVKLSVLMFGFSEYALRLVPFVAGLVSLVMFFIVARSVLRPVGVVVATLMFSLAMPLVLFSANLKQYSSDVLATLIVLAAAFQLRQSFLTRRTASTFALVSVSLLFCSQVAIFSLTAAGVVVLADAFVARRDDRRYRVAVVAFWAMVVVATVTYSVWAMTPVDRVYLQRFWRSALMPREGAIRWLWKTVRNVFGGSAPPGVFDGSLHYAQPSLFMVLLGLGAVAMCTKSTVKGAMIAGPVVLAVMAAGVRAYPFGTRVSLFLLPLFLLLVVAGAEYGDDG